MWAYHRLRVLSSLIFRASDICNYSVKVPLRSAAGRPAAGGFPKSTPNAFPIIALSVIHSLLPVATTATGTDGALRELKMSQWLSKTVPSVSPPSSAFVAATNFVSPSPALRVPPLLERRLRPVTRRCNGAHLTVVWRRVPSVKITSPPRHVPHFPPLHPTTHLRAQCSAVGEVGSPILW